MPQFRFDKAAAAVAATSALLLTACNLDAQKTMGKMVKPTVKGEPAPINIEDSTKRQKPPVIIDKPIKKRWEECVMVGDTIAPLQPPKDTIKDTSSKIKPPVPNINMLGGPKMIEYNPEQDYKGIVKLTVPPPPEEVVMGKPKPQEPADTTKSIDLPEQPVQIFDPVEPEPKGGTDEMNRFLDINIRWPEKLDHNLTVFVQVRIDKEGKVFNAYIIRGYRRDVDSEAIRVARLVEFIPARDRFGATTESVLTIPVNFTYKPH